MNENDRKSFIHVSWPEIAVAAVLTAILVAVIVLQFAGRSPSETVATGSAQGDAGAKKMGAPQAAAADGPAADQPGDPWQPPPLDDVIDYDPFEVPTTFLPQQPQESASESQASILADEEDERAARLEAARAAHAAALAARAAALDRLSQQGFNAFLAGGNDGNVAVIGSQTVRVGDVMDGFRVVAIEPDGVVVEPAEKP